MDRNLKHVIALLRAHADAGTLVPEQQKVLETAIQELRKAGREASPQKMRAAIDKVVLVFLRALERGDHLSK